MKWRLRVGATIITILSAALVFALVSRNGLAVGSVAMPGWLLTVAAVLQSLCAALLWHASSDWPPTQARAGEQPKPEEPDPDRRRELVEEYKMSQASAEHHDTLLWRTTGLVWGASLVLLGFLLSDKVPPREVSILASILGVALTVAVWWMVTVWNKVMRIKYQRCQALESQLGYSQHKNVEGAYPHGLMKWLYGLVSVALLCVWLWVLSEALSK